MYMVLLTTGVKGASGVEACIRCEIKGMSFSAWASFYAKPEGARGDDSDECDDADDSDASQTKGAGGGKKKESNTIYFATVQSFEDRKIEDLLKYKDHVTHCTPCNLDPDINYVSMTNHGRCH